MRILYAIALVLTVLALCLTIFTMFWDITSEDITLNPWHVSNTEMQFIWLSGDVVLIFSIVIDAIDRHLLKKEWNK